MALAPFKSISSFKLNYFDNFAGSVKGWLVNTNQLLKSLKEFSEISEISFLRFLPTWRLMSFGLWCLLDLLSVKRMVTIRAPNVFSLWINLSIVSSIIMSIIMYNVLVTISLKSDVQSSVC